MLFKGDLQHKTTFGPPWNCVFPLQVALNDCYAAWLHIKSRLFTRTRRLKCYLIAFEAVKQLSNKRKAIVLGIPKVMICIKT